MAAESRGGPFVVKSLQRAQRAAASRTIEIQSLLPNKFTFNESPRKRKTAVIRWARTISLEKSRAAHWHHTCHAYLLVRHLNMTCFERHFSTDRGLKSLAETLCSTHFVMFWDDRNEYFVAISMNYFSTQQPKSSRAERGRGISEGFSGARRVECRKKQKAFICCNRHHPTEILRLHSSFALISLRMTRLQRGGRIRRRGTSENRSYFRAGAILLE